jgi:hypothetical protein
LILVALLLLLLLRLLCVTDLHEALLFPREEADEFVINIARGGALLVLLLHNVVHEQLHDFICERLCSDLLIG